jgi:hypothetical protein
VAVTIKITVLKDVIPYSLVDRYQHSDNLMITDLG